MFFFAFEAGGDGKGVKYRVRLDYLFKSFDDFRFVVAVAKIECDGEAAAG